MNKSIFEIVWNEYCEKILFVFIEDENGDIKKNIDWNHIDFLKAILFTAHGWTVKEFEEERIKFLEERD